MWTADENNPATVVIAEPNSTTTAVTGFTHSGDYTFYWKTRYCEYSVVVTNVGVDEVPAVTSPVNYCKNATAAPLTAPALNGYTLAWYTQPDGGTASTTAPTPDTATEGTASYYVAYVNASGCEGPRAEIQVVVSSNTASVVGFAYDADLYCASSDNPVISLDTNFTTGGTFTATPEGLSINPETGAIDLAASTSGTYTITYTLTGDSVCNAGGTHSYVLSVTDALKVTVERECKDENVWLQAVAVDGAFIPEGIDYVWRNENGMTVGSNSFEFNVAEYYAQNPGAGLPLNFTVTVGSGDCENTVAYTVTNLMCQIPRGISPNADGDNDTFDLTGLGVTNITIFNRYGREVYSLSGTYTNQWHGQDKNNKDLPDGTYFYSLNKSDGTSLTGWVYISKEY